MSSPDHVENTGDNLRHAAEVQDESRDADAQTQVPPEPSPAVGSPPDFNT